MAEGQGVKRKRETEETADKKPKLANETEETSSSKKETARKANVENVLYEKFYRRRLREDGLTKHGCPLPDGKTDGTIKPGLHAHGSTVGLCKRCETPFDVTYEGQVDSCKFHTMASKKGRNGKRWPHNCCGRPYGNPGCRSAPKHVHESNRFNDLKGFRQTTTKDKSSVENRQVYCLDTESIHTKKGREVCRVSVLDTDCKVVYETMCLPTTDIIDYNTIWSGLTKTDLDGVTKTFTDVQNDLLELFSDETVLVGHCISSDLLALKLIHKTVVETQDLYPHDRGFPFRRGLKELARNVLHREIQSGASGLYEKFYNRRLSEDDLFKYGCPVPDERNDGHIKPASNPLGTTVGICSRCKTPFDVTYEGNVGCCRFHPMAAEKIGDGIYPHNCCGRLYGSPGCRAGPPHVHESNVFNDLTGFLQTPTKDKDAVQNRQVYCLDTESIHTKKGLEVCQVTVLDTDCKVVYETMCLPTTDIVDYNTIWSGLTSTDLDGVTKTFTDVQSDLLELFSDKTVLVGHCIKSDLLALKLIHKTVVETQQLYPHDRGFPFRLGLKVLAEKFLHRVIQSGDGHKSKEDAEVTMKLALRAIKRA